MMKPNRYKIVFCTPALYSAGGVERMISVKASYFAEQYGYNITVIVTEGKGSDCFFPISDKVNIINYELGFEELWKMPFLKKVLVYILKQRQFKKRLKADLKRLKPDFVVSTLRREINFLHKINDESLIIGELHVNRANYRNIGSESANIFQKLFSYLWLQSLINNLQKLDKMVVLTNWALKDWPELNNVVKISDALPFKIDSRSKLISKRIISIGRYAYDKGNDLLLQVWSIIEKKYPEWSLYIYGNGNKEPYKHQLIDLGIDQQRCRLYGTTSNVKKEYLSSSVFVSPSRFEGFGMVLIEAMACGVPVVSFDCENGPRSIITDGENGFLIPPFDIQTFADKIILLMENVELRQQMGDNAQKTAFQYDIDKIGLKWKQLFDDLKGQ